MFYIRQGTTGWIKYTTTRPITGGGFLYLPDEFEETFSQYAPYVIIESLDGEVTGVSQGVIPEPAPIVPTEPTEQDDTNAMLVDHEYRLTLIELGITEEV